MITVLTGGRRDVERGLVVRGSDALVSITDSDKPPAKLRNESGPRGVLRLAFDDAEPPSRRALMTGEQAAAVVAFARERLAADGGYGNFENEAQKTTGGDYARVLHDV